MIKTALDLRLERARDIGHVLRAEDGTYFVPSSGGGRYYHVVDGACSCPDYQKMQQLYRNGARHPGIPFSIIDGRATLQCKHTLALRMQKGLPIGESPEFEGMYG